MNNEGHGSGHTHTVRVPHVNTTGRKASVRLRLDNFNTACRRVGLDTQASTARALRIDETTLWRTVSSLDASSRFIVAALLLFDRARFEDLFEIPQS